MILKLMHSKLQMVFELFKFELLEWKVFDFTSAVSKSLKNKISKHFKFLKKCYVKLRVSKTYVFGPHLDSLKYGNIFS